MMSDVRDRLRTIEPDEIRRQDVYRECVRLGLPVSWERWSEPGRHLSIELAAQDGARRTRVLVHADQWLAWSCPQLAGIAWEQMSDDDQHALLSPEAFDINLGDEWLQHDTATLEAILETGPSEHVVKLSTPMGMVSVEALEGPRDERAQDIPWPDGWRLPIECVLTRLRMSAGTMQKLRRGDVILLPCPWCIARIGTEPIFSFQLDLEYVTVTDIFEPGEHPGDVPPAAPTGTKAIDVFAIAVDVDVVLCRISRSIEDIASLRQGATISLGTNAFRGVELVVAGQCVARGELVQIGEQLGVQIEELARRS